MPKEIYMKIRFSSKKEFEKLNDLIALKRGNLSREAFLKKIVTDSLNSDLKAKQMLKEQIETNTDVLKDLNRAIITSELETRALLHLFIIKHSLMKDKNGKAVNPIRDLNLNEGGVPKAILELLDDNI